MMVEGHTHSLGQAIVLPASYGTRATSASLKPTSSSPSPRSQRPYYQQYGPCFHRTGSIGPLRPHRAPSTTSLMLSSYIRPPTTPGRRLPAAQPPLLRLTRAGRRDLVGTPRRHDRRRVESDEVVGPVAVLRPRVRAEAALIARAASCLEERRPDHLGGAKRRLSCKSAPARRRAKRRDVGVQLVAGGGEYGSRAVRSPPDRPRKELGGRAGPPTPSRLLARAIHCVPRSGPRGSNFVRSPWALWWGPQHNHDPFGGDKDTGSTISA
jgi:hypothetical protein